MSSVIPIPWEEIIKGITRPAGKLHLLTLEDPVLVYDLQLRYLDPRSQSEQDLPAGPSVSIVRNHKKVHAQPIGAQGRATLKTPIVNEKKAVQDWIHIDFTNHEFLDLDAKAFVALKDVKQNDTRALLRMPSLWDSRRQESFADDLSGRFKNGFLSDPQKDQQGTASSPWLIRIDHAWDRIFLQFNYYNSESKAIEAVPYGVQIEAFRSPQFRSKDRVAGSTVLSDDGMVCLSVFHRTKREKLFLRMTTAADSYVQMHEADVRKRITQVSASAYEKRSVLDRHRLYPLPEKWLSRHQQCELKGTVDGMAKQIVQTTSASDRLIFDLDEVVLVNPQGVPLAISSKSPRRIAMFDHLLAIRNADTAKPYLSTDLLAKNLIPGGLFRVVGDDARRLLRVIRLGKFFYDITNKRTKKGKIIGARAAVQSDHPHERKQNYLAQGAGNFELHYFHDCWVDGNGEPLAHVLVFWCCRFRKASQNSNKVIVPQDVDRFKQGLKDVKERIEGQHPGNPGLTSAKNYVLKPQEKTAGVAPTPNRTIKLCVHLAAFENEQAFCTVHIENPGGRDGMGLTQASFATDSYQPDPSKGTIIDPADSLSYDWYTLAHEVGHALGLDDEYVEPLFISSVTASDEWTPPLLPQFRQYYGMHYNFDEDSLMNNASAPRLRHVWHFTRWINEDSRIQKLIDSHKYRVEYTLPNGSILKYFLEDLVSNLVVFQLPNGTILPLGGGKPQNLQNHYKPAFEELKFKHGNSGLMDLRLYKIGQDEMTLNGNTIKAAGAHGFDAILVVQINVHFKFVKNHLGTDWGSADQKKLVLTDLEKFAVNNNRRLHTFTLENAISKFFKKVLVYFQPRYNLSSGSSRHFRVNVRLASGIPAHDQANIDDPQFTKKIINVVDTTDEGSLFRYMLGLPAVSISGTPSIITPLTTLSPTDLVFLSLWVQSKCGGTYTCQKY